jgi:hypothetical protein
MLIDVAVMVVVQVPIVQIIRMIFMRHRCMPTARAVTMTMVSMLFAFIFHGIDLGRNKQQNG